MMGAIALFTICLWLPWAFYHDGKERTSVSSSIWIVVAWLFIHGTRPVSVWLGWETSYSRDEGNPAEALINLSMIAAGLIVLWRRDIKLPVIIRDNTWLFVFYLFWSMSVAWSDYPSITFKRLLKDIGNVVMVIVVLTDKEPSQAIRAVCVRFAYLCVPLSVVLIRYYPDWGRVLVGYQKDIQMYVGVTTHKNLLGNLVLVSALFILWDLLIQWGKFRNGLEKATFASRVLLLSMCWYLLMIIDSATSLVCALVGTGLLVVSCKFHALRYNPGRLEALGLGSVFVLLVLDSFVDIKETFLQSVERDPTLTTRTDVWPVLMEFQDSPLVGAGFNTFWAGQRLQLLAHQTFRGIIQAHNGYLETYLNGGLIGVGILLVLLLLTYLRIREKLIVGAPEGSIRLVILVTAILYNNSEASFNKIDPLWFVTLFAIMDYRGQMSRPQMSFL
jgi:O-antigen ligase